MKHLYILTSQNCTTHAQAVPKLLLIHIRYSYLAKQKIERLIRAVQKNSSSDRADYANYRAAFDPETLKYEFDGLDAKGFFKYKLYGSKAGKPVEHSIIVVLGDNDVGVEDSFLPKFLPQP